MDDLEIQLSNRSGHSLDEDGTRLTAEKILLRLGIDKGELGVSYVSAEEMALLNRDHLSREGATDVLSFPLDRGGEQSEGVPILLGDVVICVDVARRQASEEGISIEAELCLLLIHGILHIAGHDHEMDGGEMNFLQNEIFNELCNDF